MSKITIKLDRERELRYPLNTLIELEEKEDTEELSPMRQMRRMLWAGLIHEDPDLTEEEVGDMVDMANFPEVEEAIAKAMNRDAPSLTGQAKGSKGSTKAKAKPRPPKARKRA